MRTHVAKETTSPRWSTYETKRRRSLDMAYNSTRSASIANAYKTISYLLKTYSNFQFRQGTMVASISCGSLRQGRGIVVFHFFGRQKSIKEFFPAARYFMPGNLKKWNTNEMQESAEAAPKFYFHISSAHPWIYSIFKIFVLENMGSFAKSKKTRYLHYRKATLWSKR